MSKRNFQDRNFQDKVAIVTGGASGIGRAIGEQLAERGARVVLADVRGQAAKDAAEAVVAKGGEAEHAELDVVDGGAVEALCARVCRDHGRIDLMFNNAGIAIIGNALDFALEDFHRLLDVNVRGVINGSYAAYRRMAEQRSGHIVNTASLAGLVPSPLLAGYSMTKHAVVGLSTSLRAEAAHYGVRVSAVCPGIIATAMPHNAELRGSMDRDRLLKRNPIAMVPAERCARDVLRGVEQNRALIVVSGHAKAAHALQRLVPGLVPWLLLKAMAQAE